MTATMESATSPTSSCGVVDSGTTTKSNESGLDFSSSSRERTTMKFLSELPNGGRSDGGASSASQSLTLLSMLSSGASPHQQATFDTSDSGAKSPTISTTQFGGRRTSFLAPNGGKMMIDPIAPSPSSPTSTAAVVSPTGVTSGFSTSSPPMSPAASSSSSLPLKSFGNIYLFGYSSFDDLACPDIIKFVNEHATTLTFPQKLMLMLTYVEKNEVEANGVLHRKDNSEPLLLSSILSWTKDGTAFVIKSKKEFLEHVLPMFFHPSNKFPSFTRKLYRWGFRQISHLPGEIPKSRTSMIFGHEFFQRDDKSLMIHMKSITAAGTRRAMAKEAANKKLQCGKKPKNTDTAESDSPMMVDNSPESPQQGQPEVLQKTSKDLFQIPQLHSLKNDKLKEPSNAKLFASGFTGKQIPLMSSLLQPKPLSWLTEGEITPRYPALKDILKSSQDSVILSPGSFFGLNNASTTDASSKQGSSSKSDGNGANPDINASLVSSALTASATSRYTNNDSSNTSDATTRFLNSLASLQQAEAVLACLRSTASTTTSLRAPAWSRDITVSAPQPSVPYSVHAGLQSNPLKEAASSTPVTLAKPSSTPSANDRTVMPATSKIDGVSTATSETTQKAMSVGGEAKQDAYDPSTTSVDKVRYQDLQVSDSVPKSSCNGYGSGTYTATEPVLEAVHALLGFSS